MKIKALKSKRAQGMSTEQLLGLILLVLVIAVVLIAVFREDILGKLRLIPDLGPQESTTEEASELPRTETIENPPIFIAKIIKGKRPGAFNDHKQVIYFCSDEKCSDAGLKESNLLWEGDYSNAEITIDAWGWDDYNPGIFVKNRRIMVPYEYLFDSPEYQKYKDKVPLEFFQKLNGSYYYKSNIIASYKPFSSLDFQTPFGKIDDDSEILQLIDKNYYYTNFYVIEDEIKLPKKGVSVGSIEDSQIHLKFAMDTIIKDSTSSLFEKLPDYYQTHPEDLETFLEDLGGAEIKGKWIMPASFTLPPDVAGHTITLDLSSIPQTQTYTGETPYYSPQQSNVPIANPEQ